MKFPIATLFAVLAAPLAILAQATDGSNPFTNVGLSATAGKPTTLTWKPTTGGTVTITLRQGAASNLSKGTVIADNIQNSGSFTWNVDPSVVRGSDYALEISTSNGNTNYSPQFVIESTNTVASTTASSGTASTTGTATTGTTGTTSGTTATTGTTGTTMTTGTSRSGTTTGTSSSSGTASRTTASGSSASFQSTSATGGAPRATAAAGFMGLVALGAMAL